MGSEHYDIALADLAGGFEALRPPNRASIATGAADNLIIKQPGAAGKNWDCAETPYMVEPMNMLASRQHEAEVFVGPARTGKTVSLLLGWASHAIVNDPGDMLMIHMSKEKAREFSKTDLGRALEDSPKIAGMKTGRMVDDNTFDTMFRHGMWLRVAWPTVGNVSGSTYRYTACTDIDRIENAENLDGEGPLFDMMRKRTTTFLSRGMTLVESSPGKPVIDPGWQPVTAHEAPPVKGILGIYNRSDRRRWYWQCPECAEHFEAAPGLKLFHLPSDQELMETVRTADISLLAKEFGSRIWCPRCGSKIEAKWKRDLNQGGVWVPDHCTIDEFGILHGQPLTSTIVGYWLGGVAAAFQPWQSLIERHLQGLKDYALTGSEETLKTTTNVDQGLPYTPRYLVENQGRHRGPAEKAEVGLPRYICPLQTRTVVVSVDVQGGQNARFVVQAHAVGPWMEKWVIDRREIKLSRREGTGAEFAPLDPARYLEDWDQLTETILRATYRTAIDGREIRVKMLVVDTGGEDGATANAYLWYRKLRALGLHTRVRLYKGGTVKNAPAIKETMVGARRPGEKGDIPLLLCNTNLLSDGVDAGLKRDTEGPGYIHLPAVKHPTINPDGWVNQAFFDELTAEVRNEDGLWGQIRKRNETFDLLRMARVGMLALGLDKVKDWSDGSLPDWLQPLDRNSEVITTEDRRAMQANTPIAVDQTPAAPRVQRVRRVSVANLR